jgi:MOSC domain-containing protein YiiM
MAELEAGLEEIRRSPKNDGVIEMIARRPRIGEREIVESAELSLTDGLVGDNWKARGSSGTADGSPHPELQLTLMNSRVIAVVAQEKSRWALAGDQLFIDLDLSAENLPPGTQLRLGSAVIEITAFPHTGCKKFLARFGAEAVKFVNSPGGKLLRLRGLNAKIVRPGIIRVGERAKKLAAGVS